MAQARLVLKSFPGSRLRWEAWGWWLSLSFKAEFLLTRAGTTGRLLCWAGAGHAAGVASVPSGCLRSEEALPALLALQGGILQEPQTWPLHP